MPSPEVPSPGARLRALLAPRFRTWGLTVPLHLVAFLLLYVATDRLLQSEIANTAASAARQRLTEVADEIKAVSLVGAGEAPGGHLFGTLVEAHRSIDFRLLSAAGAQLGAGGTLPPGEREEAVAFLTDGATERFRLDASGGRRRIRGLQRIVADERCAPCHASGETLAVASMTLDMSAQIGRARQRSRLYLLLLIAGWAGLLGLTTALVKRSTKQATRRFEARLAAAEAGEAAGDPGEPALVLDPAAAELQESLHRFLRRHRERQVEVASRLAHTDQLASLGQLAAGLAHEIKNPLAGIQGALEILREDATDPRAHELHDEMLAELRRVNATLQTLLASARPSPPRLAATDLRGLLEDLATLLSPTLRRRQISLAIEVAPSPLQARLDPAKIRQVLLNLVNNAADAIDQGGSIVLRAGALPGAEGVFLAVQDDGPGISPENQRRIFDPFFTTKFSGTGLGLAIAKSLVEQHGGSLEVDSGNGGTTFFVLLPTPAALAGATAAEAAADSGR